MALKRDADEIGSRSSPLLPEMMRALFGPTILTLPMGTPDDESQTGYIEVQLRYAIVERLDR